MELEQKEKDLVAERDAEIAKLKAELADKEKSKGTNPIKEPLSQVPSSEPSHKADSSNFANMSLEELRKLENQTFEEFFG